MIEFGKPLECCQCHSQNELSLSGVRVLCKVCRNYLKPHKQKIDKYSGKSNRMYGGYEND